MKKFPIIFYINEAGKKNQFLIWELFLNVSSMFFSQTFQVNEPVFISPYDWSGGSGYTQNTLCECEKS